MNVQTQFDKENNCLSIQIGGNFDYSLLKDFRAAYTGVTQDCANYIIDLRNCEIMDSSALGMLLNMKSTLGLEKHQIKLRNCRPTMKRVLLIARFDKKFEIE